MDCSLYVGILEDSRKTNGNISTTGNHKNCPKKWWLNIEPFSLCLGLGLAYI